MKKLKRLLAMTLSVVMLFSCTPTSVHAATQTIYYDSSNIQYATEFSFTNPHGDGFPGGTHTWDSSTHVSYIHVDDGVGYCIQPGIRIGDGPGDKVTYIGGAETDYYTRFSRNLQKAIELAKLYGYPNKISSKNGYYATQVLIWGLIIGQVDPVDFTGTNKFYTCLSSDSKEAIKPYYDQLLDDLKSHSIIPSFASKYASQAKIITLEWNSSNKRYEAKVTDTNGILSKFDFALSGVTCTKSGNTLTLSSTKPIESAKTASSSKELPDVTVGSPNVWYSDEGQWKQEVTTGAAQPDPVPAYVKVQTEQTGTIALKKTSEDGKVSGVKFKISGNGISKIVTTGTNGTVNVSDLPPGTYTVSEVEVEDRYTTPESQTVKLTEGKTVAVSFDNTLKKFRVQLRKSDAETGTAQGDAVLDGAQYTLYNQQGKELETLTITNGKAVSSYYPCQTITIRETKAPVGYQLDDTVYTVEAPPEDQTEEYTTLTRTVEEDVIKGKVAIIKFLNEAGASDTDTKPAMEGIEFTVTLNSDPSVKAVITTDENGYAETGLLPYGVYTVTETKYPDSVTPVQPFTVNISQNNKVYQYILANDEKGSLLKIIKADQETGHTIALAGAGFRIKDLATGEWVTQHINYPEPTEIDEFFTGSDGTLMLPTELPYGDYELYETVPPVGYLLYDEPIPFTIDGTEETVSITCRDTAVKGEIQVEKTGERFAAIQQEETPYGTQYTPIFAETGLPDVEFTVTAADGTLLLKKTRLQV